MDKFNKQYSPEELEEMKKEMTAHKDLIELRREKQRQFLMQQLQEQQSHRLRNILK